MSDFSEDIYTNSLILCIFNNLHFNSSLKTIQDQEYYAYISLWEKHSTDIRDMVACSSFLIIELRSQSNWDLNYKDIYETKDSVPTLGDHKLGIELFNF